MARSSALAARARHSRWLATWALASARRRLSGAGISLPAGIEAIGNLVVLKYQAKFVLLAKWLLALAVAFAVNLVAIGRFGAYGALAGLAAGYVAAACVNFYYIRLKLAS